MKVILSRKGFDGQNGGKPSPIMPLQDNSTLLSLPIPYKDGRPFSELHYGDKTYSEIITELGGNGGGTCHLDPDIRPGVFDAPTDWKPAFGQCETALSLLNNQNVGIGDVFLFFGWFKQTIYEGGQLKYIPKAPDLHIIYGFLQVGQIITAQSEIDKNYHWHPHAKMDKQNNCLYLPGYSLSWDNDRAAFGVFKYRNDLVLTKDGLSRSCWKLPSFFEKLKITGLHGDSWKTDPNDGERYCQIADKMGQEFVIEENDEVSEWAKKLIDG